VKYLVVSDIKKKDQDQTNEQPQGKRAPGEPVDFAGKASTNGVSSRLPGFYELPISERLNIIQSFAGLSKVETQSIAASGALGGDLVDVFIENGIGTFELPLGIATNFRINGKEYLVPMAVEETSVVAAASHGAKLARAGGGFIGVASPPIMTGQVQLLLRDKVDFDQILISRKSEIIEYANNGHDRLIERGGGAIDMTWRFIPEINSLIVHLHINTCDAMGANIVNTMCEKISVVLAELFACDVGLRILTNLTDRRMVKVSCSIPSAAFDSPTFDGKEVVRRIVGAYDFAYYDIYRAATNNKGVMNGIDPVLIATGNDWRAVESGAHAWAAHKGVYRPLAVWTHDSDFNLHGVLEIPMAVGVVGGVTKLHPTAKTNLKILGSPDASEFAQIVTAVGLAQNLSALRALASEGIQRGHMGLHKRNLDLLTRQGATRK
jgi:hydroxymethylglutaryl-CoA reductase